MSFAKNTGAITPVILNTAGAVPVYAATVDSAGAAFSPDDCAHAYAYSAGLLLTDTATNGTSTWVKTYGYTSGSLTSESKWVKQ